MRPAQGEQAGNARVVVMLVVAAIGAIVTAPREYPVTAFLLAPLGAAIVFGRRVTTVVAVLATVAGALFAIVDDHYHGAALWFRLFFLVVASIAIVALTAVREHREEEFVTEQTRLRDRSEQRYRSLVEATSAIVSSIDADGRFLGRLPAWEAYTGQSWPDYADTGWLEAVHPEGSRVVHRRVDGCVRFGPTPRSDVPVVERRDRQLPLHQRAWRSDHRERHGARVDGHDHRCPRPRRGAPARLRRCAVAYRGVAVPPDGVFVTASDGRIIDVNDVWPRLFGFTRDEVLGTIPPYAWWPDPDVLPRSKPRSTA